MYRFGIFVEKSLKKLRHFVNCRNFFKFVFFIFLKGYFNKTNSRFAVQVLTQGYNGPPKIRSNWAG